MASKSPFGFTRNRASELNDGLGNHAYTSFREGEWKFHAVSAVISEAVISLDRQGRIADWNRAAEDMFGYGAGEAVGQDFLQLLAPGTDYSAVLRAAYGHLSANGLEKNLDLMARRKTGEDFPIALNVFGSLDEGGGFLLVAHAATASGLAMRLLQESRDRLDELMRQQEEMEESFLHRQQRDQRLIWQLMHHDQLTGLPNRMLIRERISVAAAQAQSRGRFGVLVIGIKHFQEIIGTLGQGIGDYLLTTLAARFNECVGPNESVARLEGDEFAVILPSMQHDTEAERCAQRLLESLGEPISVAGHKLVLSAAIGIAIFPDDGKDADALLRNAGAAMGRAKQEGSNAWQLYAEEYNAYALERLSLEEDLRRALEREEFEVYYQPQVDLARGVIDGAEALIRWHRPGYGMVSPVRFIPLAEEIGLIVPIGEWVLRTACAQFAAWQKAGGSPMRVSVNLSARQFRHNDLTQSVRDILKETGLPPESLELEITESMLMQDVQKGGAVLKELRGQGVHFAIDDFGTGYSSLNYLKRFPISTLKIDQSFVRQIPEDNDDAAIVRAVIALGHGLNLKVVAEGVETEQQLAFMREHRCDRIQGYYFSPPVDAARFEGILNSGLSTR